MSISTIYRVSQTLPEALTVWLSQSDQNVRHFENAIGAAFVGHTSSGSNAYSVWEEWAEFCNYAAAKNADNKAREVVFDFHCKALKAGFISQMHAIVRGL